MGDEADRHINNYETGRWGQGSDKKFPPVKPGFWHHEGTDYEIATMPMDIIQVVVDRRKKKGLFIHPKMAKRLKEAGLEA